MSEKNISKNLKAIMVGLRGAFRPYSKQQYHKSQAAVSQIINGQRIPTVASLITIMQVIPVTFERLVK